MTDAMAVFRGLKQAYLRYFESPFDLRFDELVEDRRRLLDRDSVLYRDPLIEPQPPYIGSGRDIVSASAAALGGAPGWSPQAVADLGQFASNGLFLPRPEPIELYRHQVEMLQISAAEGRDAVILTGTGSGKTESIYLPVFASLIREFDALAGGTGRSTKRLVEYDAAARSRAANPPRPDKPACPRTGGKDARHPCPGHVSAERFGGRPDDAAAALA